MIKTTTKVFVAVCSACAVTGMYLMKSTSDLIWDNITMPLINLIDAERAHQLAVKFASIGLVPSFPTREEDKKLLKTSVWGLSFDSPIGLAAGFDKHGDCINGMLKMGFGFVEVGSITPKQQSGNPKPRVFRLIEDDAVINRYGFNSFGLEYAKNNLSKFSSSQAKQTGILAVNLGKNKETENAVNDYAMGVLELGKFADYLVINISSPNTPGLRRMQGKEMLKGLIEEVLHARSTLERCPPLLVKIAPDLSAEDKEDIAAVLTNPKTKVDGLVVCNTTITRPSYLKSENKKETGGLSGKPLRDLSTKSIKDMFILTQGCLPIIGVGGVSSGEEAYEAICNGASLVQLYSALSLRGPPVVGKVKRELADILRNNGYTNVKDAVGSKVSPHRQVGT